ncbi:uncharacterized protein BX663DRAFT_515079 [Cokeromyces recurvatus]|uniref:uncharacterized protein n=1 Tax=Cokeromyces recurvatus TaxID=90255 RepID=UPI00221F16DE|nr:uncharacterized protein BX663DRAFT_515079 [Cokeromyces recurvatus]KAI7901140.1 hypothetical protein BX663DRAFT_515079 [Cokeromyces recurvatus]
MKVLSYFIFSLLTLIYCTFTIKTDLIDNVGEYEISSIEKDALPTKTVKNDKDKEISSSIPVTTAEVDILYTTDIDKNIPSSSFLLIPTTSNHNTFRTSSSEQQPLNTTDNMSDKKLEENLKNDQQALKRMIIILSLVGGLGFMAVITTIIIFIRMRSRNEKIRRKETDHSSNNSTFELNANNQRRGESNTIRIDSSSIHSHSSILVPPQQPSFPNNVAQTFIEPSAPSALELLEEDDNDNTILYLQPRRHSIMSVGSQHFTAPSAPTEKELDTMQDNIEILNSNSLHHHHCSRYITTDHTLLTSPAIVTEIDETPPPAYTPSAPPHYILPFEVNHSSSSSRRQSLGD